jgi:hypothetical protein
MNTSHSIIGISGLILLLSIACARRESTSKGGPEQEATTTPASGGTCLREGEEAVDSSARFPGEVSPVCCEGLQRVSVYDATSLEHGECIVSKADRFVCSQCGNGACDGGENRCNCDDCR